MTVVELTQLLASRGAQSFVLQFFAGSWQATVRVANGIGPQGRGETMLEAVEHLVEELSEVRP